VQVHFRCERQSSPEDFRVNAAALRSYVEQVRALSEPLRLGAAGDVLLSQVLALPGVVPEPGNVSLALDNEWPVIQRVLEEALGKLQAMRQEEGRAMAQELLQHREAVASELERIRRRSPEVTAAYRDRLHERVQSLLAELDIKIDRSDLIKEVAIFAERS